MMHSLYLNQIFNVTVFKELGRRTLRTLLGNNSSQMSETYHLSQLVPGSLFPYTLLLTLPQSTLPRKDSDNNSLEEEAIIFHTPSHLIKKLRSSAVLVYPLGSNTIKTHTHPHTLM